MKRVYVLIFVSLVLIVALCFFTYLLKQKRISSLKADTSRITIYKKWGFNTAEFEVLYRSLLTEAETTPFILLPFQDTIFQTKHDTILRLTQAGYATEISKQKEIVRGKLTYLRERVKNDTTLSLAQKQKYFDTFEVVAGEVFEMNSDLNSIAAGITNLEQADEHITNDIETIKKEALIIELQGYKRQCETLYAYFTQKNAQLQRESAAECINEADVLLNPSTQGEKADILAVLSREKVFTLMQQVLASKQKLIQDEQYALEMRRKEEEKLTLVPPSPRQEGKVILVNLSLQRLYAYENGKTIFTQAVPITTGKNGFETVTGEFAIYLKKEHHQMVSPFPGIYYDDVVNYWMPFYLGYGLHDAPWRAVYGTQDYPVVGSHGCVNMPFNEAKVLYNWAEVGTRVIVI